MSTDGISYWADIEAPKVSAPGGILNYLLGIPITTSAFISASTAHFNTDFEIRTAPNGGGSLVYSLLNEITGKLGITIPALTLLLGQTYYVRARLRGADGSLSMWSTEVILQT